MESHLPALHVPSTRPGSEWVFRKVGNRVPALKEHVAAKEEPSVMFFFHKVERVVSSQYI